MAIGPDRVQVLKFEEAAKGGDAADDSMGVPSEIQPQEDVLESAGIYLQDGSNRDENVYIDRDGNDLRFRDQNNTTPITLSTLAASGDVVGPSSAADRSVAVFDGTTGKLIEDTPFYISGLSINPGTTTLSLAALVGVNTITDGGSTAEAIGNSESSVLVGTADAQTGSTARIRSNFSAGRVGTVLIGAAVSAASPSAVSTFEGSGSGAFGVGLVRTTSASTSTINTQGDGSLVAGEATQGGTLTTGTNANGAFVQGFATGIGIIRATGAAGAARGYCSNGLIESTGTGNLVNGYTTGGTLRVQGSGSVLVGNAGTGTVSVQGGGSMGVIFQTGGTSTLGFGATGSAMVAVNFGGNITHNGSGSILIGNIGAGSTLSSGFGANGSVGIGSGFGVTIAVNAANAIQLGPGTNSIALSAQIGNVSGTGIQILGGGTPPGAPVNGQIWKDSTGQVFIRSAGSSVAI